MELSDLTLGFVGFGAMAQQDVPHYAAHVKRVLVTDINAEKLEKARSVANVEIMPSNAAVAREADITIVAVTPIRKAPEIVLETAQHAKYESLISDYTSVKTHVEAALKSGGVPQDLRWSLLHPMRGPSLPPKGQTHVLVHDKGKENKSQLQFLLEQLIESVGGNIAHINSAREHDTTASLVQSATHFTYFALAEAYGLAGFVSEQNPEMPVSPYLPNAIDHLKWVSSMRVCAQHKKNREIYPAIAAWNPSTQQHLKIILEAGSDLMKASIKGDEQYLRRTFSDVRDFLGNDSIKDAESQIEELVGKEFPLLDDTGNPNISLLHIATVWCKMGSAAHPGRNMIFASPPYKLMTLATLASFAEKRFESSIRNVMNPRALANDTNYWMALQRMSTPLTTSLTHEEAERFYSQRLTDTATRLPQPVLDYCLKRSDEIIKRLK